MKIGERTVIKSLSGAEKFSRRLSDMGFVPGTTAKCVGISPFGDPKAYLVRGAVIALRNEDAKGILGVVE